MRHKTEGNGVFPINHLRYSIAVLLAGYCRTIKSFLIFLVYFTAVNGLEEGSMSGFYSIESYQYRVYGEHKISSFIKC